MIVAVGISNVGTLVAKTEVDTGVLGDGVRLVVEFDWAGIPKK